MNTNSNEFLLDNRIAQRNIRDGRISREAYEKQLASLPDLAEQCDDIGEEIYGQKKQGVALTGDFISNKDEE